MNRKSYSKDNILLGTSFLLPILGFETSERVMKAFHKLSFYNLYYNDLSLLEALWKIVKIIKTSDQVSRVTEGVRAIRDSMKYAPLDEKAVENAIYMYRLGHKDMIDNLLYSIAVSRRLKLLTVDDTLIEFVEEHKLAREYIMAPEELR